MRKGSQIGAIVGQVGSNAHHTLPKSKKSPPSVFDLVKIPTIKQATEARKQPQKSTGLGPGKVDTRSPSQKMDQGKVPFTFDRQKGAQTKTRDKSLAVDVPDGFVRSDTTGKLYKVPKTEAEEDKILAEDAAHEAKIQAELDVEGKAVTRANMNSVQRRNMDAGQSTQEAIKNAQSGSIATWINQNIEQPLVTAGKAIGINSAPRPPLSPYSPDYVPPEVSAQLLKENPNGLAGGIGALLGQSYAQLRHELPANFGNAMDPNATNTEALGGGLNVVRDALFTAMGAKDAAGIAKGAVKGIRKGTPVVELPTAPPKMRRPGYVPGQQPLDVPSLPGRSDIPDVVAEGKARLAEVKATEASTMRRYEAQKKAERAARGSSDPTPRPVMNEAGEVQMGTTSKGKPTLLNHQERQAFYKKGNDPDGLREFIKRSDAWLKENPTDVKAKAARDLAQEVLDKSPYKDATPPKDVKKTLAASVKTAKAKTAKANEPVLKVVDGQLSPEAQLKADLAARRKKGGIPRGAPRGSKRGSVAFDPEDLKPYFTYAKSKGKQTWAEVSKIMEDAGLDKIGLLQPETRQAWESWSKSAGVAAGKAGARGIATAKAKGEERPGDQVRSAVKGLRLTNPKGLVQDFAGNLVSGATESVISTADGIFDALLFPKLRKSQGAATGSMLRDVPVKGLGKKIGGEILEQAKGKRDTQTRYDAPGHSKGPLSKVFDIRGTADVPVEVTTYETTKKQLKRLQPNMPDDEIEKIAKQESLEAVFANDNKFADGWASMLRNFSPAVNLALDTIVPYPKVPSNVAGRITDYTPGIGHVKAIKRVFDARKAGNVGIAERRNIARLMSRSTAGIGLAYAGHKAAEKHLKPEEIVTKGNYVKWGESPWLDLEELGPQAKLFFLAAGARAVNDSGLTEKQKAAFHKSLGAALILDNPVMRGSQSVATLKRDMVRGVEKQAAGHFIPGFVKWAKELEAHLHGESGVRRKYEKPGDEFKRQIPVLNRQLPKDQ